MNERPDANCEDPEEAATKPWEEELTLESQFEKATSDEGDIDSAWDLIESLVATLDHGATSPVLFKFAADFFAELLWIRSGKEPKEPTRAELSEAFDQLHIFRRTRGRPELDDVEIVMRFAAEDQLLKEGKSGREVRRAFAEQGIDLRGVHAQRRERADLLKSATELAKGDRENFADKLLRRGDWADENK